MKQLEVYFNDIKAGFFQNIIPEPGILSNMMRNISNLPCHQYRQLYQRKSQHIVLNIYSLFFSNMLPEGANRRVICRVLKIDENDFFGLLETMADRDFIGAVNIRRINND